VSGSSLILPEVTIESWSTTLKLFELSRKLGVHNLLHSFEVSNCIYLSFVPLITRKIASFTGKWYFSRLCGQKMSPMHVTLKAGVMKWTTVMYLLSQQTTCYEDLPQGDLCLILCLINTLLLCLRAIFEQWSQKQETNSQGKYYWKRLFESLITIDNICLVSYLYVSVTNLRAIKRLWSLSTSQFSFGCTFFPFLHFPC